MSYRAYMHSQSALTVGDLAKASSAFLSSPELMSERASWDIRPCAHLLPSEAVVPSSKFETPNSGYLGWFSCYTLLLHRALKNCMRNPGNLLARVCSNFFLALTSGLIFFQVTYSLDGLIFLPIIIS